MPIVTIFQVDIFLSCPCEPMEVRIRPAHNDLHGAVELAEASYPTELGLASRLEGGCGEG